MNDELSQGSISAFEGERIVQGLSKISLADYGSNLWLKQHESLQKLNIQSHINAQSQTEEFITESLITFDKMELLIHELLVAETWRTKVMPYFLKEVASQNTLKSYFLNYHEAAIINLLEIVFFTKEAVTSCGDALMDLVDYCARKIVLLNGWEDSSEEKTKSLQQLLNATEEERFLETKRDLDFGIAISALSVFRYITDNITTVPLGVTTRILFFHEMACTLVHLIEKAPWLRRKAKKQLSRYENGVWKDIAIDDLPQLTKIEAQVWLALYNILLEPECRKKYDLNEHNKTVILRLKPYLISTLVDQLPILENLQRYLEELTILQVSQDPALVRRGAGIEQLPEVLQSIIQNVDFKELASKQRTQILEEPPEMRQEIAKSLAGMYNFNDIDALLEDPKCAKCGLAATQRCSRCKNEWYCARPCQVKAWKAHKSVCDILCGNK